MEKKLQELGFDVARSLGQSVYVYLPGKTISALNRAPEAARRFVWSVLDRMGIRLVPGMIRENKLMGYWFGRKFRRLLSKTSS